MMNEKFIASEGNKVLTRIIVKVGKYRFESESLFSDANTLEALLQCLDTCATTLSWKKEDILQELKRYLESDMSYEIGRSFLEEDVSVTIEQYENRYTVSQEKTVNSISALIKCIAGCAVQSTYLRDSVIDTLKEYVEEQEDLSKETEENNNE